MKNGVTLNFFYNLKLLADFILNPYIFSMKKMNKKAMSEEGMKSLIILIALLVLGIIIGVIVYTQSKPLRAL